MLRRRLNDLEFGDDRLARSLDLGEPRRRGGNHLGKGAEFFDQGFGERLYVAPRHGSKEHEFQEFVIGECTGAAFAKARAQAVAMAMIMRRFFEVLVLFAAHGARLKRGRAACAGLWARA
jgi:hypothetical protein